MANPQTENGFTRIANELLEALIRYKCSGLYKDVILTIIRYSYGFQRKTAEMSVRELAKELNCPKETISRALKELIKNNVIKVIREYDASHQSRLLSLNKDYETWNTPDRLLKNQRLTERSTVDDLGGRSGGHMVTRSVDHMVTRNPIQPIEKQALTDTQRKIKKIKKEYCQNSTEFRLSNLLLSLIKERRQSFKEPNLQAWCEHIDKLIRLDKQSPEEIERVIQWCQGDVFWQNNILSTDKLRQQYERLALRMGSTQQQSQMNKFPIKSNQPYQSASDRIML